MEKETSSLVTLGIALVAIAAVITLAFGIFAVAKRLANKGESTTTNSIELVDKSYFDGFNQEVVSGIQVKNKIADSQYKNITILLNTASLDYAVTNHTTVTGDLIDHGVDYYGIGINDKLYINYGLILEQSKKFEEKNGGLIIGLEKNKSDLKFKDGHLITITDEQTQQRFKNIAGITKTGTLNIKDNTKFNSTLIYNDVGNICGIMFDEIY